MPVGTESNAVNEIIQSVPMIALCMPPLLGSSCDGILDRKSQLTQRYPCMNTTESSTINTAKAVTLTSRHST